MNRMWKLLGAKSTDNSSTATPTTDASSAAPPPPQTDSIAATVPAVASNDRIARAGTGPAAIGGAGNTAANSTSVATRRKARPAVVTELDDSSPTAHDSGEESEKYGKWIDADPKSDPQPPPLAPPALTPSAASALASAVASYLTNDKPRTPPIPPLVHLVVQHTAVTTNQPQSSSLREGLTAIPPQPTTAAVAAAAATATVGLNTAQLRPPPARSETKAAPPTNQQRVLYTRPILPFATAPVQPQSHAPARQQMPLHSAAHPAPTCEYFEKYRQLEAKLEAYKSQMHAQWTKVAGQYERQQRELKQENLALRSELGKLCHHYELLRGEFNFREQKQRQTNLQLAEAQHKCEELRQRFQSSLQPTTGSGLNLVSVFPSVHDLCHKYRALVSDTRANLIEVLIAASIEAQNGNPHDLSAATATAAAVDESAIEEAVIKFIAMIVYHCSVATEHRALLYANGLKRMLRRNSGIGVIPSPLEPAEAETREMQLPDTLGAHAANAGKIDSSSETDSETTTEEAERTAAESTASDAKCAATEVEGQPQRRRRPSKLQDPATAAIVAGTATAPAEPFSPPEKYTPVVAAVFGHMRQFMSSFPHPEPFAGSDQFPATAAKSSGVAPPTDPSPSVVEAQKRYELEGQKLKDTICRDIFDRSRAAGPAHVQRLDYASPAALEVRNFIEQMARVCWLCQISSPPLQLEFRDSYDPEWCNRSYNSANGNQIRGFAYPALCMSGTVLVKGEVRTD